MYFKVLVLVKGAHKLNVKLEVIKDKNITVIKIVKE